MQLEHVEKHIAATTAPVMSDRELKRLERMKAFKDFLQSWWFAALIVVIGAPTMVVGQMHQRNKVDKQAVLENRLPAATVANK